MSVDLSLFTVRSFIGVVRGHLPKNTYKCVSRMSAIDKMSQTNLAYINTANPEAITFVKPIKHDSIKGFPVTLTEIIPITRVQDQEKMHVADLGYPIITDKTIVDGKNISLVSEDAIQLWREVTVDYSTTKEFVVRDSAKKTTVASLLDEATPTPNAWKESAALEIIKENKPTWSSIFVKNTKTDYVDLRATKP